MEFQSDDQAWYDVKVSRNDDILTVKYVNFSEEFNETFHVGKFKTIDKVNDFKRRFRQSSVQLQDQDCHKIFQGKTVCASYNFNNGEVKFFDAMVVEVLNEKHKVGEEEEECSCTYVLKWHDGSLEGERTFAKISDICLTPPGNRVDPSLAAFLKIAMERIDKGSLRCEVAGHEEPNTASLESNPVLNIEAYFMKLRRQRKNRFAVRTTEGRVNGRCKRFQKKQIVDKLGFIM
ncbi:hypothetical protein JCGZ_12222 [Jatropha curcas]|uniref:SAWADEE domain-containing protein n=1 Tax=Jatropha curcas TaxID=180498 RepID=A0A067K6C8_JATCU|nr:hypothetical protein JCGZ_12222 [Jatropha curcas]